MSNCNGLISFMNRPVVEYGKKAISALFRNELDLKAYLRGWSKRS